MAVAVACAVALAAPPDARYVIVGARAAAHALPPRKAGWSPLCVLYQPGDWMWYWLECGDNPPPKDPTT